MAKYLLLIPVVFLALMVLPVALVLWLGWKGWIVYFLVLIALGIIAKKLIAYGLRRAILSPFMAKSHVLKGAQVRVNSLEPAPKPQKRPELVDTDGHEHWEELGDSTQLREYENCNFYYLDVTITPQPGASETFQLWEPGELVLVDGNTQSISPGNDDDDHFGLIEDVVIWQNGGWATDQIGKYEGPQRVRIHAGVPPGVDRARLRYYFEVFGELDFPASRQYDVYDSIQ